MANEASSAKNAEENKEAEAAQPQQVEAETPSAPQQATAEVAPEPPPPPKSRTEPIATAAEVLALSIAGTILLAILWLMFASG